MLIISWNVAGLSTTLQRIDSDYSSQSRAQSQASQADDAPNAKQKLPKNRNHAFSYFLARHGSPDILCIQEHKISLSQLSSRSEKLGASTVEGYESFWSCCTDPNQKGFHGVVTYAKRGTVLSADSAPLKCPELDTQGRCIMTDHGSFVVFNVYVPASGGAMPLSFKMKFLNALRGAMQFQRETNKKRVILVGDFNIVSRREDLFWEYRSFCVDDIRQEVREVLQTVKNDDCDKETTASLPQWKRDLHEHWDAIAEALQTKKAIPVTTRNRNTGATFQKYRLQVKINEQKTSFLGKAESSDAEALAYFNYPETLYYDTELQRELIVKRENTVCIEDLQELMSKIAKVEWGIETLRLISRTDALCQKPIPPHVQWFKDLLKEDEMIDPFQTLYPTAEGRFTCWNQQTNRRFENKGARIDYTLLDESLFDHVEKPSDRTLQCCKYPKSKFHTEEASLHAATASGALEGASYEGGGIRDASQEALDTQFHDTPHTGIIYTPPSYSDHVAVSLVFKSNASEKLIREELQLDEKDPSTRKSQPHKSQQSIASFFKNATSGKGMASAKRTTDVAHSTSNLNQKKLKACQSSRISSFFNDNRKNRLSTPAKPISSLSSSSQTKVQMSNKPKKDSNRNSIMRHFSK